MRCKGVIMKLHEDSCYVLTNDSQFLEIPLPPNVQIGQEIEFDSEPQLLTHSLLQKSFAKKRWMPIMGIVASVLIAIGVWQGYSVFRAPQAYAFVTVDINPSVEFVVDTRGKVMQQDGLNEDGSAILSNLSTVHLPIQTAVESLSAKAQQEGYLKPDGEILITAAPATDQANNQSFQSIQTLQSKLVSNLQQILSNKKIHVKVQGIIVSKQVRSAARKYHLSPGKFALFLQAQSQGLPVTLDEVRKEPISKILEQHKELSGSFDKMDTKTIDSLLEKWDKKSIEKPKQALPKQEYRQNGKNNQENHKLNTEHSITHGSDQSSGQQQQKEKALEKALQQKRQSIDKGDQNSSTMHSDFSTHERQNRVTSKENNGLHQEHLPSNPIEKVEKEKAKEKELQQMRRNEHQRLQHKEHNDQ
ncbi:anti-sigma factor domain-containing protein [Fodinisporobacter ferrooxydans]|uniref:Anti-sigma factor domain-containing protein n=1 Tax=Fodinisporobacter ferrooxydans TaxID=2901836 RepID=A0ABY4CSV5_9BACL|nr:anti-sigma factor domain-containing protein [Alicyclobacillaceae bacterium MYW30-H2]